MDVFTPPNFETDYAQEGTSACDLSQVNIPSIMSSKHATEANIYPSRSSDARYAIDSSFRVENRRARPKILKTANSLFKTSS